MSSDALRVHVITEEDPFYLPVFFERFFAELPADRVHLTGIDITPPLNQKGMLALARRLYEFYGPVDFVRLGLRYAVAKLRDLVMPHASWNGTVARQASASSVPCREVEDVNAPTYVAELRALDLDVLVSVAASQIFRAELLSVPKRYAINIHTGRLPDYRGMLPVFWQMYEGEETLGITIHTMTEEIDRGDLLLTRDVPLDGERSLDRAIRKGKWMGARAMLDLLQELAEDRAAPRPMPAVQGGYRSFPKREHAARFRAAGNRLL